MTRTAGGKPHYRLHVTLDHMNSESCELLGHSEGAKMKQSPLEALHEALMFAACIGTRGIGECTRNPALKDLRSEHIAEVQRGRGCRVPGMPSSSRRRVPVRLGEIRRAPR